MTKHREELKEYLGQIHLDGKLVIDFGSGSKPALKYISHTNCKFFCIDKNESLRDWYQQFENTTYRVIDIEQSLPFAAYDVAFCIEVIEHIKNIRTMMENIHHALVDDGVLYLSAPFLFPIHSDEDYWRFTENGIRVILDQTGFIVDEVHGMSDESGYFIKARKAAIKQEGK